MSAAAQELNHVTHVVDRACCENFQVSSHLLGLWEECDGRSDFAEALREWIEEDLTITANELEHVLIMTALSGVDWFALALRWERRYNESGRAGSLRRDAGGAWSA